MPTLFPEDYEKASLAKKRNLTKRFKQAEGITAIDIALQAHMIYDYLKQQGIENPNGLFVEAFQYASTALGVPYDIIDEAFWTQVPLSEKTLFDFSTTFNPNHKVYLEKDLPNIPITINFYGIVESYFDEVPVSFFEPYLKKDTILPKENIDSYDLESLLQALLQEVWLETKAQLDDTKESTIEKSKQMFLAYFYSNDKKHYRSETQGMLLELLEEYLKRNMVSSFVLDEELEVLLSECNSEGIVQYVLTRLGDWGSKKNYKRFLRSIPKTKHLSLMNQLLLLYQRSEPLETKEVHDWIKENRTLLPEAKPIFLFGKNTHEINSSTGEIIEEKRLALLNHETLPVVPYFEKSDTSGRDSPNNVKLDSKQLFVVLEKLVTEEVVFEELEESVITKHKIKLKAGQSKSETLQDFIVCILDKEKNATDKYTKFENRSVAFVVCLVLGLDSIKLDYSVLESYTNSDDKESKLQELLTKVIFRSECFVEKLEQKLNEKQPTKVRPSLDEEIKNAKDLQGQALANVITGKENKKESKSSTPFSMDDYLEKVKEKSEGVDDVRANQESTT